MTRYRTIVADPPWPMPDTGPHTTSKNGRWDTTGKGQAGRRSRLPYGTLSVEEITALPIRDLADADSHLYLWTTNRFLWDARAVAEGWGFQFSTLLTWCKPPMGLGFGGTFSITSEYVLFCRRGGAKALSRHDSTWMRWPRPYAQGPLHSAKPEAFLDLVEQTSPPPRLELFARRARFGWDYWGDESLQTIELGAGGRA